MPEEAALDQSFTSREAARISGVPFFTLDYWGRTRFLLPSVSRGDGRGKGRERIYSFDDVLRMRIARALRDQKVSLETLRRVIAKLAALGPDLRRAQFVLIGRKIEIAESVEALVAALAAPERSTFGILLDLRLVTREIEARALARRGADVAALAAPARSRRRK